MDVIALRLTIELVKIGQIGQRVVQVQIATFIILNAKADVVNSHFTLCDEY